jgi:hypothetical protein
VTIETHGIADDDDEDGEATLKRVGLFTQVVMCGCICRMWLNAQKLRYKTDDRCPTNLRPTAKSEADAPPLPGALRISALPTRNREKANTLTGVHSVEFNGRVISV